MKDGEQVQRAPSAGPRQQGAQAAGEPPGPAEGSLSRTLVTDAGRPPEPVPHRAQMERLFGRDLSDVKAHTGAGRALSGFGADAATKGDTVAFASLNPEPSQVAHELTHVMQHRKARGSVTAAAGGVSKPGDTAELEAQEVAALVDSQGEDASPVAVTAVPSAAVHLDHGKSNQGNKTKTDDQKDKADDKDAGSADRLEPWVGSGKVTGKVFRNTTHESFVDKATGDSVDIQTRWTLADFFSYELKTEAVMEVDRTLSIQLGRGQSVLIKARDRAWFHAERLPNDVQAALQAPAKQINHEGRIFVTDDQGMHLMNTSMHFKIEGQSVAQYIGREPMLAYGETPEERIRDADRFVRDTVPHYEQNLELIAGILRDAPEVVIALQQYIKAKLEYEDGDPAALALARHMISRIETVVSFSFTGYEGEHTLFQLSHMMDGFQELLKAAEQAKPADKHFWDHVLDLGKALVKAVVGLAKGLKEFGLMARDLGTYGLDKFVGLFGYEIDWSPRSAIGQAYKSGKSTSEILSAVVNGIIEDWEKAIEHASNGDYSKLMDLGAEIGVNIAFDVATGGSATGPIAAERAGLAARGLARVARAVELTEEAAKSLIRGGQRVLKKAEQVLKDAPLAARDVLLDLRDVTQGLVEGLTKALKETVPAIGSRIKHVVLDPGAIPEAIRRVRGARAIEAATGAMKKLRGEAPRSSGKRVIRKLENLAKKPRMQDAIHAVARRIAEGEGKAKFVEKLDDALGSWMKKLDEHLQPDVLSRAAGAVDPVQFLDDVEWVMTKKGFKELEARTELLRQAVARENPLDLGWLRKLTDLPDETLEFMAIDPATNWRTFMKVSKTPSDYFPSAVKKLLRPRDYAQAAAKLRGVAGELMFEVQNIELPEGLKIIARQVDAAGKKIDFRLQNAAGKAAKLEVKAWNAKRWAKEIAANKRRKTPKGAFGHMVDQLQAAKATKEPVYLAVSDAIEDKTALLDLLEKHGLGDVTVITFPESKLGNVTAMLRKGLALEAAVGLVTAHEIAEVEDDD